MKDKWAAQRRYRQRYPERHRARVKKWQDANPEYRRECSRRSAKRLRDLIFQQYGGALCLHCGISDPDVLTLDHIDDDGKQDRARKGTSGGYTFFLKLKKASFPPGYQVLCRNCNWKKHLKNLIAKRGVK